MGRPEASSSRPFRALGRRSIGQQLAVLVLVATVPSFLFVIWHLVSERERDGQIALNQVRQLADNAANRVQVSLHDYATTLTLIAEQPLVKLMDPGVCDPLINSFVRLNPEFVTIGTRDLQGNAICTFLASPPTGAQVVEYLWFQQALRAGTFHASDVFYAPLGRRWVTVLSTPIRNDAATRIGMVVMPLDLLAVNQMVMKDVPSRARVSVLDRQYRVMMRSDALSEWVSKPAALQMEVLRAAVQANPTGVIEMRDAADVPQIIAYRRLPVTEWLVSAELPRDEIFAAADTALRNGVLGSITLLVLALGLAWRLARGIVRPLEAMVATTNRIAAGDMDARMPQPEASSDVAKLGAAFNHMLQARQQAEQSLRENEENLAITLQSIGDAVIATDLEGRVIRMNPAAERLTGWDRTQADGRPLGEVFRISSIQGGSALADPVQQVLATGEMVGMANDTELVSRDGSRYHIADSAAPIRDKDGALVGGVLVFSDVSAQYEAQRDLREAFNFFRQILDNLPLGLNVMDAQGRYLEWNPAMEAIRGRTKEEMLGRTVAETYPREPAALYAEVMDAVARAVQGEQVLRTDVPIDGAIPPVWTTVRHAPVRNAQGKITGSLSIVQDVTERKLAEMQLRASEQNLAITLQSIGDAVMATDLQGRVTRMNPVAERLTGWSLADALGQPLREVFRIVHAVTREVPMDPVQRVLASGEVVGLANHTALLSRDGSERHISDSAAPIRDAYGKLAGVVLVFSDVSEQYQLQQVLLESEQRYRALMDASPVAVAVHQHQRVVFVNPAAVRLLAAENAAALLGRWIGDFVHLDHHASMAQRATQTQGDPFDLPVHEWRYLRVDGSVVEVQAQVSVIRLNGKPAVQVSFMDITARKQAEARLRDNEARFRALTSLSSDWYWEQDAQYCFVRVEGEDVNSADAASRLYPVGGYVGRKRWELSATQMTPSQWDEHRAELDAHREFRDLQLRFENLDGTHRWASVSGMPVFDERGTFCGYRGIGRDITAQKVAEEQINALAFYDALTQLPNRRLLIEQLKQALVSHARSQKHGALLFIDLDNFKTLNDTLGHETGDQLLMQVAQRVLSCVREADTVARLGGDEFVVMLQDLSTQALDAAENAEHIGHKILAAFAPLFQLSSREYRSTPSIGITLFGDDNQSVEDLLKQADLAMYQAKAAGRNTLRMFDEGMQAAVDARAAMESDLRQAIALQQFVLHYQPVVDKAGLVSGAEALVRWEHPVRGRVAPGHFIPLAESTRLIVPLGLWVLDAACAQLAQWGVSARTQHLSLAVNVSAHQFMEPDFVAQVVDAIERSGADPQRLKLELTESLLADNIDDVIRKMSALRVRGIDFSLDDFGTGYSSLSYLKLLPLAHLKIDQSFVRDLLVDSNDAAIARTIVALGASRGLAVIAEGVETQGQYQLLLEMGCETFQGYWFARPVPIADFDALLTAPLPR
jgi:diguanylate cyclase (GGDEF)-like protein/PAS domain S-box-containing protein